MMILLLSDVGKAACGLFVEKVRTAAKTNRVDATSALPLRPLSAETTLGTAVPTVVVPLTFLRHNLTTVGMPREILRATLTLSNTLRSTPTTLVLCPSINHRHMPTPVLRLASWFRPITMPVSLATSKMVVVLAADDSPTVVRLLPSDLLQHLRGLRLVHHKTLVCHTLLPLMLRLYTTTTILRYLLRLHTLLPLALRFYATITTLR